MPMLSRSRSCLLSSFGAALLGSCLVSPVFAGEKSLVDTSHSPSAKMYMADLGDVQWNGGLWGDRFDVCRNAMIPSLWTMFQSDKDNHSWANFLIAAGEYHGDMPKHSGAPFNDGDFLKWFEGVAQVYAITKDPKLDELMDRIIPVLAKAQREDGYFHTMKVIPQRAGIKNEKEFEDREHFETYNMGHLMTAACIHYRATGKTTLLDLARKSADYLYAFYKRSSPDLARNAICPSHYMGVVELYRVTREPRYLELAKQLIEIRDLVTNGTDHNQDRVPFRKMTKAVGHAVRANYLYAGVADVVAETGDQTLLTPLETIARDVEENKLYITGMTGALYDGASPAGCEDHAAVQLVHQAYGRDYQLPNLTAYNETCATIGYALWDWRMLALTGDAHYADLLEQTLYNGVLPGISLEGKDYFYVNPLRKESDFTWPMRWWRTRQPNIQLSFCCPPNVVRTIAEAQDYVYSLSKDAVWVNLYGASSLHSSWVDGGGSLRLSQVTEYPWEGSVRLKMEEMPARPIELKLRIPAWIGQSKVSVLVNGERQKIELKPGAYASLKRQWKAGDEVRLELPMEARLVEANPLVEETVNQVAVRRGPLVYCVEANDLPEGVKVADLALPAVSPVLKVKVQDGKIAGAPLRTLRVKAFQIQRSTQDTHSLYRDFSGLAPRNIEVNLVPYYAWGNRGDTDMSVWMPVR